MPGFPHFEQIRFDQATALNLVAGAITVTQHQHVIDEEGGAADQLDTINGGVQGDEVTLRLNDADFPITLTAAGNIRAPGGKSITLAALADYVVLNFNGTNWIVTSYSTSSSSPTLSRSVAVADSAAVVNPAAPTAFDVTAGLLANTLVVGTKLKITGTVRKTAQGGADQSTYTLRFAGVTLVARQQSAAATAIIRFEAVVVIRTVGAGGTFESVAQMDDAPLAGGAVAGTTQLSLHDNAIDTTAAIVVDVQVTRSVDDGGNSQILTELEVETLAA